MGRVRVRLQKRERFRGQAGLVAGTIGFFLLMIAALLVGFLCH